LLHPFDCVSFRCVTALLFVALEIAPIWFFLRPSQYMSIEVEYLVLLPIYLFGLFYLFVQTMKFLFERVIPEAPGLIMDMLSQATEKIARESYFQYAEILEKEPEPLYYGRVYERMLRKITGRSCNIISFMRLTIGARQRMA
jgi:hypothetical protein